MLLSIILTCLGLVLFIQPIIVYLLDRKNLRRFPAPSYAGISSLWRMIHSRRQRHFLAINEAHNRLGTHVRIAPNHISIAAPEAMNDIYGHGANFEKEAFYDSGAGPYRDMINTRSREEHQGKRKLLAHAFAQKTLTELDPIVMTIVRTLVTQIDTFTNTTTPTKPINMRRYLNYFTIDFLTGILFGEPLHCLEQGNDIVTAETTDGKLYKVPYIATEHATAWMSITLGMEPSLLPLTRRLLTWHSSHKAGIDWVNIVRHTVNKRLQVRDSDFNAKPDLFSRFLQSPQGEPLQVPRGEIEAECSVMMIAGTDTTAASLTHALYLICRHPHVLAKLQRELDDALPRRVDSECDEANLDIPAYADVAVLPYLRACIEESLRLRPSSTLGLPRVVPQGGRVIAGHFIEEGVTVSVPTYTLLKNPDVFPDPYSFNPDRWLTDNKAEMQKCHFPFSYGPRACIGRNISYLEQLLVTATLVRRYEFVFQDEHEELPMFERSNCNPGELWMYVRRR